MGPLKSKRYPAATPGEEAPKTPGRGRKTKEGPGAARCCFRELPVRLVDFNSRPSHWKLEAYPAGHLRRSENWPKWLVVSAKRCITREPLPLSITDHLGKGSGRPFQECQPPGTLSGQGLLSCIERVPNVATDVNHQRPKETRQHARKATPRIPPAYYKEGLVRFTEKRPELHQPWSKQPQSW